MSDCCEEHKMIYCPHVALKRSRTVEHTKCLPIIILCYGIIC